MHLDRRIAVTESGDQGSDLFPANIHWRSNAQLAFWDNSPQGDGRFSLVNVRKDLLAALVQKFAFLGEVELAGGSDDEVHSQARFKGGEAPAHGGGGRVQRPGGGGQVACRNNCGK
jgi:hypothetical protein